MNRRISFIWHFIRRLGGVAGVTQRIVLSRQSIFTWSDIHSEFCRRYPGINPADTQIIDMLETMERSGQIECVIDSPNGKIYRRCAAPRFFQMFKPKPRQLEFTLW